MAPVNNYTYAENMDDIFAEISSRISMHSRFLSHIVLSDDEASFTPEHNNENTDGQAENAPMQF